MTQRNITRYTYETTSFQGWRLSICRKWNQFTKYFSDRQYGSEEAAFQAAIEMRDRIFDALNRPPMTRVAYSNASRTDWRKLPP